MIEVWCVCEGTGVMPVLGIHIICPKCKGVGLLQIKGEDMSEDGLGDRIQEDKQPFAYEEELPKRLEEIQIQYEKAKEEMWTNRSLCISIRDTVRNFFQERYTDNEHPDDLTFDIDEINQLLKDIDASQLSRKFEASATVEITFKVHAEDKDDAENIISDYLGDLSLYVSDEDDYEIDSCDIYVSE
jgi:hypothetical protein